MIKHHPSKELLAGFVGGNLPASIAIGVSIHCQMCEQCRNEVAAMTDKAADIEFEQLNASVEDPATESFDAELEASVTHASASDSKCEADIFADMFDSITADDEISEQPVQRSSMISVRGNKYELPKALNHVHISNWMNLGKLSRSSLNLDEGPIHSHLLYIDKDGEVPAHTHKGYEITLLLEGSFEDELGEYHPGDFIEVDGRTTHQPKTKSGCLCYTVADDALVFTEGFHKLFNPIGNLLY